MGSPVASYRSQAVRRAACSSRATLGDLSGLPLMMNAPWPHREQIRTRGRDAALAAPICPQLGQTIRVSMSVTTAAAGAGARRRSRFARHRRPRARRERIRDVSPNVHCRSEESLSGARCAASAKSKRGAPACMATSPILKRPVSSGAQKISVMRIRSIDCECEGGRYGALRRLSAGTLTACSLTAKAGHCSRVPRARGNRARGGEDGPAVAAARMNVDEALPS